MKATCPCCGTEFELAVQGELPIGPIALNRVTDYSCSKSTGNRLTAKADESSSKKLSGTKEWELMNEIRDVVGDSEMQRNGGLWRYLCRLSPRAMAHAIEDWKLRTPEQRKGIKKPAAWLTDRFKRDRAELKVWDETLPKQERG